MTPESNFGGMRSSLLRAPVPSTGAGKTSTGNRRAGKSAPSRKARPNPVGKAQPNVPVLIIDQSEISRAGLAHMLADSRFRIVGSYSNLASALQRSDAAELRLALISLGRDDVAFGSLLRQRKELKIVAMAERFDPQRLLTVMEMGVSGYLLKQQISRDALLATLDLVMLGAAVIPRLTEEPAALKKERPDNESKTSAPEHLIGLSSREETILGLLTRGASNKQIARELDIAEATVKVHVKSLLRKLHVANRTQAAMWAMKRIRPDRPPAELTCRTDAGGSQPA